jgi:hypothetical protein
MLEVDCPKVPRLQIITAVAEAELAKPEEIFIIQGQEKVEMEYPLILLAKSCIGAVEAVALEAKSPRDGPVLLVASAAAVPAALSREDQNLAREVGLFLQQLILAAEMKMEGLVHQTLVAVVAEPQTIQVGPHEEVLAVLA